MGLLRNLGALTIQSTARRRWRYYFQLFDTKPLGKDATVIKKLTFTLFVAMMSTANVWAITWGTPDNKNERDNVVTLLFIQPLPEDSGSGFFSCSGTLLSPRVVLTAGHCTGFLDENEQLQPNLATWLFTGQSVYDAYDSSGFDGFLAWILATWQPVTAVPHPEYKEYAEFPRTYDVGVLLLDVDAPYPTNSGYGLLPEKGKFDSLDKRKGKQNRSFTVVGYGAQELVPLPFVSDDWARYIAEVTVTNTKSSITGDYNFQLTNNPGKGNGVGGTCFGDSGGPSFWLDSETSIEYVSGITSFGITQFCTGVGYNLRTDIDDVLDFVLPYLP